MKKVTLLLFVFIGSLAFGQKINDSKANKLENNNVVFKKTKELVESKSFKFVAQWKRPGTGTRETMGNILNYIIVKDESIRCQLQLYNFKSLSDPENTEDIYYEGDISKYDVDIDEKKNTINVSYFIKFRANILKVDMLIRANGYTKVTLAPRDNTILMTYYGNIE
ncbi:DUF4251 domain-containing protein [Winogradskyella sp. PE311]|uniref:DUF4251 domain-containing protein n=1 Tax=Winogradskyella sp. PE311 TaxID=3366943 RepID=UPI00397F5419